MFLIRPTPFEFESLSSWRQRSALANGYRVFPRPPNSHSTDPDRLASMSEMNWLADNYLADTKSLTNLTLDGYAEKHFRMSEL